MENNKNYFKVFGAFLLALNLVMLIWLGLPVTLLLCIPIFLLGILSKNNKKDLLKVYIGVSLCLYLPMTLVYYEWFWLEDTIIPSVLLSISFGVIAYLILEVITKEKISPDELEKNNLETSKECKENNKNYFNMFFVCYLLFNLGIRHFIADLFLGRYMSHLYSVIIIIALFVPIVLLRILSKNIKKDLFEVYSSVSIWIYFPIVVLVLSIYCDLSLGSGINSCILIATLVSAIVYLIENFGKKENMSPEESKENTMEITNENEEDELKKDTLSLVSKTILRSYYWILAVLSFALIYICITGINAEGYRSVLYGYMVPWVHGYFCSDSGNTCILEK